MMRFAMRTCVLIAAISLAGVASAGLEGVRYPGLIGSNP